MKVLGLSALTLLFLGMMLAMVRFWGLSQHAKTFDHPWFHLERPWRVVSLKLQDQAKPSDFIWVDVIRSDEGNLFAATQALDPSKKKWPEQELRDLGFRDLKSTLESLTSRNLILNILSNTESIDLQLSDLIGNSGKGRLLIQSEFDAVLIATKKLQPLWLYGSSQAERVRFRTFESLWILPAATFKGDVYIGPFKQRNVPLLTENVAAEIKRRGQRWIAGPLETKEDYDLALRLGADGVFIDREELLGLTSGL